MELKLTARTARKIKIAQREREPVVVEEAGANDRRARRGVQILAAYAEKFSVDLEDAAPDLLSDLMHLADRTEELGSFSRIVERARYHYDDEILTG